MVNNMPWLRFACFWDSDSEVGGSVTVVESLTNPKEPKEGDDSVRKTTFPGDDEVEAPTRASQCCQLSAPEVQADSDDGCGWIRRGDSFDDPVST